MNHEFPLLGLRIAQTKQGEGARFQKFEGSFVMQQPQQANLAVRPTRQGMRWNRVVRVERRTSYLFASSTTHSRRRRSKIPKRQEWCILSFLSHLANNTKNKEQNNIFLTFSFVAVVVCLQDFLLNRKFGNSSSGLINFQSLKEKKVLIMLRSSSVAYRRLARAATASASTTTTTTKSCSTLAANSGMNAVFGAAGRQTISSSYTIRSMSSGNALSSFAEPGSLFDSTAVLPESLMAPDGADKDAPLRSDIRTMGSVLGHIIQEHHGEEIFEKIESLRALAKNWREAGAGRVPGKADEADKYFQELAGACSQLSNDEMLIISRAFTHFLAIANSAESHHRQRILKKATTFEALPERYDSW